MPGKKDGKIEKKAQDMTDKTDIDNVRYSFETQEFFQRQIEEAINTLINEKNTENNKAFAWFMGE